VINKRKETPAVAATCADDTPSAAAASTTGFAKGDAWMKRNVDDHVRYHRQALVN
jgi:hypothetical protein